MYLHASKALVRFYMIRDQRFEERVDATKSAIADLVGMRMRICGDQTVQCGSLDIGPK